MHSRTRLWLLAGLALLLAVVALFWRSAGRRATDVERAADRVTAPFTLTSAAQASNALATAVAATNASATISSNDPLRFRLSNTPLDEEQLLDRDQALLLMNALVDTERPLTLAIPEHLRAKGEAGAYIVQSRGPLNDAFRTALRQAGAEIVSYVPNNAYLVRASAAAVAELGKSPGTQAVLAWEPYFKLEDALLELAVEQKPLPYTRHLNLLVYPSSRAEVELALAAMSTVVTGVERSPFGVQLVVRPPLDALVALAQLPGVQRVELNRPRKLANDQARTRLRVSTNALPTSIPFRNLTGQGVLVNVNDTGVEEVHPALMGRVLGLQVDFDGHGTHVAGTIAGDGSGTIASNRIPGSISNASYKGIAPAAEIFAQSIAMSDSQMQEGAAGTNAFISNNSWGYIDGGGYTLAAASWDAAVRDALPGVEGSQPLLAVFAAGNSGGGPCGGLGEAIDAPASSKNVITVGALENLRRLSNLVTVVEYTETNQFRPWLDMTDSSNQVASFSRVGNIGRRREGQSGRFKPDVMAPGTFVISARGKEYLQPTNWFCIEVYRFPFVTLDPDESDEFSVFVPLHGDEMSVQVERNEFTAPGPLPRIPIYADPATPATTAQGDNSVNGIQLGTPLPPSTWYVGVENKGSNVARFDVVVTVRVTNNLGDEPEQYFNLNAALAPDYRYESGTSMAAPAVSGVLALMQQYFTTLGATNSPALMKALLINGARSANDAYDFNMAPDRNRQGWGLVNITNSVPGTVTAPPAYDSNERTFTSPTMACFDQTASRALATGGSFTRTIDVAANATTSPLRFSLVWTDPPGNPSVGVKLVNDLDLVVTNLVTGEVFVGNGFGPGNTFSPVTGTNNTNGLVLDRVNNVENVYVSASFNQRLSARYSVTVSAKRVNVNAVTGHPDGVVQDFALVISHGNPRAVTGGAITVGSGSVVDLAVSEVTPVTNGVPLLNQRAGANSPLVVPVGLEFTNGNPAQWHFFVVTNRLPESDPESTNAPIAAATNMAFATFLPPNLSRARTNRSDIDLYVTQDPNITNLVPAVIAAARKSLKRVGTESIVLGLPDLAGGEVFYAGVKCEDQQGANFGFFAVSSSSPFSSTDTNGNVYVHGRPFNVEIPDGTPAEPQAGLMFGFAALFEPIVIQNVIVTNGITHTNGGDLFGSLDLDGGKYSVLNANRSFSSLVPTEFIYDDSESGELPEATKTDTPGTLRNFVGDEFGAGNLFQLTMVDSAPGDTGQVNYLDIKLEPRKEDLTNGVGIVEVILPGRFFYTVVDVSATVTNLEVCASPDAGIVEVYIRRADFPTREDYDKFGIVAPPGECIGLGLRDSPPLSRGRYYIGIFNPNATAVTVGIKVNLHHDLRQGAPKRFRGGSGERIIDDAVTTSTQFVGYRGIIADAEVGVRIAHERVSDLVLHLTSPEGTRLLLTENRGRETEDYGFGTLITNVVPVQSNGSNAPVTNIIVTTQSEGTVQIDYEFYRAPDRITVYYEGVRLIDTGFISGNGRLTVDYGPGISTNVMIIANEGGNPEPGTRWNYVATVYNSYDYATFTESTIKAKLPIKFEPPPFTNFNYFETNFVTNITLVADSFEDRMVFQRLLGVGQNLTGWSVVSNTIDVVTNAALLAPTNAPWFLPPYEGRRLIDINGLDAGAIRTNLITTANTSYRVTYAHARPPGSPAQAELRLIDASGAIAVTEPVQNSVDQWTLSTFFFNAIGTNTALEIAGTTAGDSGVLFDYIRVEQITTNIVKGIYYHPEEPLTPLLGQEAFGNWTLEVTDNRVGGGLTNALLGWRLNLTFVNTNPPAYPLTNLVEACVTMLADETIYFYTDVPITASSVTNFINATDEVDVFYNQAGLPALNDPPDTAFFYDVQQGETVLGLEGWNSFLANGTFAGGELDPAIAPGKRYYLALHNRGSGTNYACVKVAFDELTPNLVGIIALTNQCYLYAGVATNAGAIDYYSFDVSSNAIGARFSVSNILGGDVSLVVSRGLPLPNANRFAAKSDNAGPVDWEFIEVADFFQTTLSGRWYIGVIHADGAAKTYQICAEEVGGPIIEVLDRQLHSATNGPAGTPGAVAYYKVYMPDFGFRTNGTLQLPAILADFQLTNIADLADMDLYLSPATMQPLFSAPSNWMYRSTNFSAALSPNNYESNRVSAFSITNPLTPGWWFIAAVNNSPLPTNYGVHVTMYTTNLPYIPLTNGVAFCDELTVVDDLAFYQFNASPDALQVAFEVFNQNAPDVDLFAHTRFPVPPAGFLPGLDLASTNGYPTNEFISPRLFSIFGREPWYLTVKIKQPVPTNVTTFPVGYCIRAAEITQRDVQPLTNGVAVCKTIPVANSNALYSGVQFHSIDVVGVPLQATFETFDASGNVDLYVQRDLPFTNYTTYTNGGTSLYPYSGEQLTNASEYICLGTNSTPVALSPGRWYVVVVNRDPVPVDYCLRASFISSQNLSQIDNGEEVCRGFLEVTNGGPILGHDFYTFRVASNAVQALFETTFMSGNVDLFLTTNLCLTNYSTYDASLAAYPYYSTNLGTRADVICIRTNTSPVNLAPGDWYLTVVNREPATPVFYCVRATQIYDTNIVRIATPGPLCTNIPVADAAGTNGVHYFIVGVSNNPVLMNFQTTASGNVDLYVTRDPCLPNFVSFDATATNYPYSSTQSGTNSECLSVGNASTPVALTNGDWYVVVVNRSAFPVDYCLTVTPFATDPAPPLTANVQLCGQTVAASLGPIGVEYHSFDVPPDAVQVTFEVTGLSGDADLYVNDGFCFENRATFPIGAGNAAHASENAGTADETVVVSIATRPNPLQPGPWFVAVVNRTGAPVNYCVKATLLRAGDIVALTNAVSYTVPFQVPAGEVRRYSYRVSTNAIQATFEVLAPTDNVDLYVERAIAPANIYSSSYASTNGGTTNEHILVQTNGVPTPLGPGEWFLAVTNTSLAPVTYSVRVTEILDNTVVRLFNGQPRNATVEGVESAAGIPLNHYVFTVSNAAVRAQFEAISPDGDVTLVARRGLPLPDLVTAQAWSTNAGNSAELIVLFTNSTPVALAPGDWYLGVLNNTNVPVNYSVAAWQFFVAGTNVTPGPISITATQFCASYSGVLPGVNYYVEGTMSFDPPIIWVPITPTIRATSTVLNWCISLPNTNHYFRVREGLSPLSAGPVVAPSPLSAGAAGVSFEWNAPSGERFVIEYSDTLAPAAWRPYPGYVTSTNGVVSFQDDGTRTGGLKPARYYRFIPVR